MYDLKMADKIRSEMINEDSQFDKKMIDLFRKEMPEEYIEAMKKAKYGEHIIDEDMYKLGLSYITDNDGKKIDLWSVEDVLKIAKDYIDMDDEEFYDFDLALWSNVKKGDYEKIISEASKIIRIAIADLTDKDYYCNPSERAYKWVKHHIEKDNED